MNIEHNSSESRGQFEAKDSGKFAGKMVYSQSGSNEMVIEHTEVDSSYQGQGVGKQLVDKSAEYARDNNLKIIPECSYAKKVMERSSDYDDVLA